MVAFLDAWNVNSWADIVAVQPPPTLDGVERPEALGVEGEERQSEQVRLGLDDPRGSALEASDGLRQLVSVVPFLRIQHTHSPCVKSLNTTKKNMQPIFRRKALLPRNLKIRDLGPGTHFLRTRHTFSSDQAHISFGPGTHRLRTRHTPRGRPGPRPLRTRHTPASDQAHTPRGPVGVRGRFGPGTHHFGPGTHPGGGYSPLAAASDRRGDGQRLEGRHGPPGCPATPRRDGPDRARIFRPRRANSPKAGGGVLLPVGVQAA